MESPRNDLGESKIKPLSLRLRNNLFLRILKETKYMLFSLYNVLKTSTSKNFSSIQNNIVAHKLSFPLNLGIFH